MDAPHRRTLTRAQAAARHPGRLALSIPLFSIWLLVYDRQQQSEQASGIAEGWGGPQTIAGPVLVIPYRTTDTETVTRTARGDALEPGLAES